jgi:predicted 2-oxoglutarate/Fe(II)-dependent dioxygenase YbiX/peroxiredoxin
MAEYVTLLPGDPAPWFIQRATTNPRYVFDSAAGRFLVLCFFGSSTDPQARDALNAVRQNRHLFDDQRASFFGVTLDTRDEGAAEVTEQLPGMRFLLDFNGAVSRLYGSVAIDDEPGPGRRTIRRFWVLLDPSLRVAAVIPFAADGSDRAKLLALVASLPPPERFAGFEVFAPVLILPHVFEPSLCSRLIASCANQTPLDSIFMREEKGRTVGKVDYAHKRRRDYSLTDETLRAAAQHCIRRRLIPELRKAYQFEATRMERYLVACYDADDGGHFRAHRDNTTKGTAHRRFAVSINLNADFDGGEVMFPEYGPRSYKPDIGGAVVFSCSLLHAVTKVTRGQRYAFLPFLYDEQAAQLREANNSFVGEAIAPYQQSASLAD